MSALDALFRDEVSREGESIRAGLDAASASGLAPDGSLSFSAQAIKGAARVVGFPLAERLADALETLFVAAESGRKPLTSEAVAACRAAAGWLDELAALGAAQAEVALGARKAELDALLASLAGLGGVPSIPRSAAAVPRETSKSSLELFRLECEVHTATLTDGLLQLEREPQGLEVIERLMRSAHSIKGAARVVGLDSPVRLAHVAEDQLIRVQRGAAPLTAELVERLLQASDMLLRIAQATDPVSGVTAPLDFEVFSLADAIANLDTTAAPREAEAAAPVAAAVSPEPVAPAEHAGAFSSDAEEDRILRVRASHLSRLVALSGESLVETRRLKPFADTQHRLRTRQAGLAALLNDLHQALGAPSAEDPVGVRVNELRSRLSECRDLVSTWVEDFEEHARRSEDLTLRLFREATASRMRPLGDGLAPFPRLVRDVAKKLGKKAELALTGEELTIDRDILEKIEAPLNHILRNAVDHGLEPPDERRAAGKPERGVIRVDARHRSGLLEITVSDDGRGIDVGRVRAKVVRLGLVPEEAAAKLETERLLDYIFAPGFSTAEEVTELSGRGVGLDVVQSALREVGGGVHVTTEAGRGTAFHLRVPVSRSVIRAVVVQVAGEPYAFPLTRIDRLLTVSPGDVRVVEDRPYVPLAGESVALVATAQVLELPGGAAPAGETISAVVASERGHRIAFSVERFIGEYDLVVRPLDPRLGRVADISAAAILPDGAPVLIVDVEDLVRSVIRLHQTGTEEREGAPPKVAPSRKRRILIVDDSITVRELEKHLLVTKGYDVVTAVDGMDGWGLVRETPFDLVITDVDMPRMDGISLTRSIKQDPRLRAVPVIIVSYRGSPADQLRGLEAAADRYMAKSEYEDEALLQAVVDLIGGPDT